MITIVDYGMGNLRSVQKAFEYLGFEAQITGDPAAVARAERVVLPGVGAFCDAMAQLRATDMDRAVMDAAKSGKPLLGICLGMQMMFEWSGENGYYEAWGCFQGESPALQRPG